MLQLKEEPQEGDYSDKSPNPLFLIKNFQKFQMKKHCLNSSISRLFFEGAKIPSMSKVKKVANLNTPNSVSLPQTRAFTLERSLSTKKLTNPPKGDKGIE